MKLEIRTEQEIKKQSLEQWINYKIHGSIMRSRTRWYNEREKNTKYFFFELEKGHFNSKTIRYLKIDDNTTLNIDKEILDEAKRFYQALYTSDNSFCQNVSCEDLFFST